jgi:hypothetical protein
MVAYVVVWILIKLNLKICFWILFRVVHFFFCSGSGVLSFGFLFEPRKDQEASGSSFDFWFLICFFRSYFIFSCLPSHASSGPEQLVGGFLTWCAVRRVDFWSVVFLPSGFGHRYQVIVFDSAAGTRSDSSSVLRFSFWSQNPSLSVFGSSTGAASCRSSIQLCKRVARDSVFHSASSRLGSLDRSWFFLGPVPISFARSREAPRSGFRFLLDLIAGQVSILLLGFCIATERAARVTVLLLVRISSPEWKLLSLAALRFDFSVKLCCKYLLLCVNLLNEEASVLLSCRIKKLEVL